MEQTFRLPGLKLAEEGAAKKEIQLFRTGTFYHTQYGKFEITPEILKAMEDNFKNNIRGIDIPVNYRHDSEDIAAGWLKDVKVKNGNELWAEVDWTPSGEKVLSDREFRYISPEFTFDYQDNENLKKFGPVLLGAGLTNIPTIKRMEPVALSEYKLQSNACVKDLVPDLITEGHPQDQAVAIAFQKCGAAAAEKVDETVKYQEPEKAVLSKQMNSKGVKAMMEDLQSVDLESMSPEQLKALVKELMSKMMEMKKEMESSQGMMAAMKEEKKLSERKSSFALMLAEGKVCKAQEESYLSGDMVKFAELAQPIKLKESGTSKETTPVKFDDPSDEILALAEKLVSEGKAKNPHQAISMALSQKPELSSKIYG